MSSWLTLPPMQRAVLPNGLVVVVLERRALPLVSLRLTLRAGSGRDPAGLPGMAALAARLLRHGSGGRTSERFAADLDFIGGHFGTATGVEHLTVDAEFTTATLEAGLDLLVPALLDPHFAEHDVERERERVVGEIVNARDEPDSLADEAFHAFLFAGHPHGHPTMGTVASMEAATREDLRRWHEERFLPAGGVLVAVGDVEAEAFLARLETALSSWTSGARAPEPPPEPARVRGRRAVLVHRPGSGQVQYRTGNIGVRRRTPDWHAIVLANSILGGGFTARLMRAARVGRGLTYGIHSRFAPGHVPGSFSVVSSTKNETLRELHDVVTGEMAALRASGPTDAELAATKAFLVGLHVRRIELAEALGAAVADTELFDLGHASVTSYKADIEAVTREAAHAAARQALPGDDLLTVVVGDEAEVGDAVRGIGETVVVGPDFAEGRVALPGGAA